MKFTVAALAACVALTACQTTSSAEDHLWVRTDGVPMSSNPRLYLQGERDVAACRAEVQKSAIGQPPVYWQGVGGMIAAEMIVNQRAAGFLDIWKGCMADRGYVLVPRSQAATRAAELRAIAR